MLPWKYRLTCALVVVVVIVVELIFLVVAVVLIVVTVLLLEVIIDVINHNIDIDIRGMIMIVACHVLAITT